MLTRSVSSMATAAQQLRRAVSTQVIQGCPYPSRADKLMWLRHCVDATDAYMRALDPNRPAFLRALHLATGQQILARLEALRCHQARPRAHSEGPERLF